MSKLLVVIGVLVAAVGVASAGTPPSIKAFFDHASNYWELDTKTNQWLFVGDQGISREDFEYGCAALLDKAKKDGVADTLAVDVPFDSPDWKKGQHTVADLKLYCDHARKMAGIATIVSGYKLGQNDDTGDIAAKCMQWYEDGTKQWKLDPKAINLPYQGIGLDLTDRATGDPFKGTLEEGRKKFCDPYAKEWLEAKAKEEAPYRKALKGAKLKAVLEAQLIGIQLLGPGGKALSIPQMAKANVWFREKDYPEKYCANGAKTTHAVVRYTFKGDDWDSAQTEYCGTAPKSAYK